MEPTREEPLVVVGAGLAGSLLSLVLARRGYHVDVFEYRSDSRKAGFTGGRSINLALSTRGLTALNRVGLGERILEECIPMHGRMIHDLDGNTHLQPYGRTGQFINSVSRQTLNEVLMDAADAHPHVEFHFDQKCVDIELSDGSPTFEDRNSGEKKQIKTRFLFGADGAYSSVRQQLMKSGRFNYSQDYLSHGYKELSIPPAADGGWRMDKNALHIWPRHDFMLIALPNLDGSFTVTLFLAWEGEYSFANLTDEHTVTDFFHEHFADALSLMPTLVEDFFANPAGNLVTVKCEPYHHTDQVLLVGDAAHAVVPFYGQGMNASFEDCTILDDLIEAYVGGAADPSHAPNWGRLAAEFSETRKADADAIADLAVYNFLEMRSKVADPMFLLKKKVDRRLAETFPSKWMPLYSMVTFSNMPYSEAKARAEDQDRKLKWGLLGAAAGGALGLGYLLSRRR